MSPSQDGNSRWRFQPLLISVAVVVGVLAVLVATLPDGRVTRAVFAKIRIGMSQDDLRDLLGRALDFQTMDLGRVDGPEHYAVNFGTDPKELRRAGYQDYRREVWISSEVTITVVSDSGEQVVCRYSSGGQSRLRDFWNWLSALFKTVSTSEEPAAKSSPKANPTPPATSKSTSCEPA